MEALALIATALAGGAAAGVHDSTSDAVGSLYDRVRQLVTERLGRRPAELDDAIAAQRSRDTSAPDPVAPELRQLLEAVQAEQGEALQKLADGVPWQSAGARGGSLWNVSISDSHGSTFGDGTHVRHTFNINSTPPVTPEEK